MATITYTIAGAKIGLVADALAGLYPIPTIPDPNDPEQQIPQFTKNQWAKECGRRWYIKQVARWKQLTDQAAIQHNEEDDLVQ
jgi:hypothetical protein